VLILLAGLIFDPFVRFQFRGRICVYLVLTIACKSFRCDDSSVAVAVQTQIPFIMKFARPVGIQSSDTNRLTNPVCIVQRAAESTSIATVVAGFDIRP
jgi:hypothetical protein